MSSFALYCRLTTIALYIWLNRSIAFILVITFIMMEDSLPQELWRKILSRFSFKEQVQFSSVSLLWYDICRSFCLMQTKLVISKKGTTIPSMSCSFEEEYHTNHAIQERDVIRISSTTIPVLSFFEKYCPNITVVSVNEYLGKRESHRFNQLLGKYSSQLTCINIPRGALPPKKKPNLIHVKAHSITQNSFGILVRNSKCLTYFILEAFYTRDIIKDLHRLPKGLKRFKMNFQGHALPEGFLKSPAMSTIESITLLNVLKLPVTLRLFSPRLKSLHLELTSGGDEFLSRCIYRYLSYLTQLEELTLSTRVTMFSLDSDDWQHLCQSLSIKLRVIIIKGNLIPGKFIPDLVSRCPLLQQLNVGVYAKIEEEHFFALKKLTKLEKLNITLCRPNNDPVNDYPSPLVTWKGILSFLKETKSRDTLRDLSIVRYWYPIEKEEIVDDIKEAVKKEFELMKNQYHLTTAFVAVHGYRVCLK